MLIFTETSLGNTNTECTYTYESKGTINLFYPNENLEKTCFRLREEKYMSGSPAEARLFFEEVCTKGEMVGCKELGNIESNKGNHAEAKIFYAKACDGGAMTGCTNLGVEEEERGDVSKAKMLYQKSCDGGERFGCNRLGMMEKEKGNLVEAKILLNKACDAGEFISCLGLGGIEYESKNYVEGKRLFQKACDGGIKDACGLIPKMELDIGVVEFNKGNLSEAKILFQKACEAGVINACSNLGGVEYKQGNHADAKILFRKACKGGSQDGCTNLKNMEQTSVNQAQAKIEKAPEPVIEQPIEWREFLNGPKRFIIYIILLIIGLIFRFKLNQSNVKNIKNKLTAKGLVITKSDKDFNIKNEYEASSSSKVDQSKAGLLKIESENIEQLFETNHTKDFLPLLQKEVNDLFSTTTGQGDVLIKDFSHKIVDIVMPLDLLITEKEGKYGVSTHDNIEIIPPTLDFKVSAIKKTENKNIFLISIEENKKVLSGIYEGNKGWIKKPILNSIQVKAANTIYIYYSFNNELYLLNLVDKSEKKILSNDQRIEYIKIYQEVLSVLDPFLILLTNQGRYSGNLKWFSNEVSRLLNTLNDLSKAKEIASLCSDVESLKKDYNSQIAHVLGGKKTGHDEDEEYEDDEYDDGRKYRTKWRDRVPKSRAEEERDQEELKDKRTAERERNNDRKYKEEMKKIAKEGLELQRGIARDEKKNILGWWVKK